MPGGASLDQARPAAQARAPNPGETMQSIAPFPLSICGIEELTGHCETGVSHVLSILDPDHPEPEAFGSFGEHARLELRFHDIIEDTPDRIAPMPAHAASILDFGRTLQAEPAVAA